MASTASDPSTALGASLEALSLIEASTDQVEIKGALLNQELSADGSTDDVVDVYWALPGRPGLFTSRVPFVRNWMAIAFAYIGVKQAIVRGIYAGLASKDDLPSGAIGPPLPAPGTLIPL